MSRSSCASARRSATSTSTSDDRRYPTTGHPAIPDIRHTRLGDDMTILTETKDGPLVLTPDLGNPLYAFLLMMLFEWGVMLHDAEADNIVKGKRKWSDLKPLIKGWWRKAGRQALKDYVIFPALSGPLFLSTLAGNTAANLVRNVWAYSIIFCGHFPSGVQTFTQEETAEETRGEWYVRQMLGSANISGGKLFHIMSGNLSHQIEHHLFPDIPANRYPEIAPEVRALCEKYGLPYHTGPLSKQVLDVWRKIFVLALPPRLVKSEPTPGVIVMRQRTATEVGV
nr:acyl-CoA desaturase [Nocardia farcinica]